MAGSEAHDYGTEIYGNTRAVRGDNFCLSPILPYKTIPAYKWGSAIEGEFNCRPGFLATFWPGP
jgi:hypothetical protein